MQFADIKQKTANANIPIVNLGKSVDYGGDSES